MDDSPENRMERATNAEGGPTSGPAASRPCPRRDGRIAADDGRGSELLLLPDGRILVHNLTPAFALLLAALNPSDRQLGPRAASGAAMTGPDPGPPQARP